MGFCDLQLSVAFGLLQIPIAFTVFKNDGVRGTHCDEGAVVGRVSKILLLVFVYTLQRPSLTLGLTCCAAG